MQAFLVSIVTVAIGEIGDKTQLLALLLAARYRKPWPIIAGIVVATVFNHTLAGWLGAWLTHLVSPGILRWGVAISFIAVAAWALIPDKLETEREKLPRYGAFAATVVTFFLAEIGDKTQIATVVLAANYHPLWQVIAGTTLGMLIADVPAVILGARFTEKLPLRYARWIAAAVFAVLGLWVTIRGL